MRRLPQLVCSRTSNVPAGFPPVSRAAPNPPTPARVIVTDMERPTKKEIKAKLEAMRGPEGPTDVPQAKTPALSEKKSNKNRIRKQGV